MPTLNQAQFIDAAIDSILKQDYPNLELIVADGGSKDDTLENLQKRQINDKRIRWFSNRDKGPAQAVNRALAQVKGLIIGWLNSDDLYTPGAVSRAVTALLDNPAWLMVYGHGQHVDSAGNFINDYPTLPPSTPVSNFAEGCFICQPTVYFRRSMFILLGQLNENYRTAFDFDYWLRAFSAFPRRIGFVDATQALSRLHDDCITLRMRRTVTLEGMQILSRYLGYAPKEWLLTYIEELFASRSQYSPEFSLRDEVISMLASAEPWLSSSDHEYLSEVLSNDDRLVCSDQISPANNAF